MLSDKAQRLKAVFEKATKEQLGEDVDFVIDDEALEEIASQVTEEDIDPANIQLFLKPLEDVEMEELKEALEMGDLTLEEIDPKKLN